MNPELKTIRLYGKLGTQFGRVHHLAVESTAEAIRAMCVILPGFERELMTSKDRGVAYACFSGTSNIAKDQLHNPVGKDDIRIAPILQGAKRGGLMQTIIGVTLIVASIWFPPLAAAGTAYTTASGVAVSYASIAFSLGMSLALGGVAQMISPQQSGLASSDGPDNGASYNFNGPVNTTAQGNPVSVLYGEMEIGSAVISSGIYNSDQN